MLRRLGFVGMILLTLAVVMPATGVQACGPEGVAGAITDTAAVQVAAPCDNEDCRDCGVVCAQGCCHAPHPVMTVAGSAPLVLRQTFQSPRSWADIDGAPLSAPSGLERPPRA